MALTLSKSSSTNSMSKIHGSGLGPFTAPASSGGARSSRRKQRCWIFRVSGITRDVKEADLLASVRERYTTVKRLVITPASSKGGTSRVPEGRSSDVLVEVQFTGPQPSEGPGALLCDLLCGVSVDAQPVELPRGRKKRARTDPTSPEVSDSDPEEIARKQAGTASAVIPSVENDDEDEDAGGGRCITAKPLMTGPGSSPVYSGDNPDSTSNLRRLSRRNSGGAVAPAADLNSIFVGAKGSSPSSGARVSQETRGTHLLPPQPNHLQVYSDVQQPQSSQHRHQQQQSEQGQQVPHRHQAQVSVQRSQASQEQRQPIPQPHRAGTQQWEEVVRRVSSPSVPACGSPSHALDIGTIDMSASSPGRVIKSEFDPLLPPTTTSTGPPWGSSNDDSSTLLDTMPTPQDGSHREWFDTTDVGDGDITSGNIMDIGDVNDFFQAPDADGMSTGGTPAASGSGSNADAGAGERPVSETSRRWVSDGSGLDGVTVEASRKDCDFEGCPANPSSPVMGSRSTANLATTSNHCLLMFTGLDRTGLDLRSLKVTVHFGVDSVHKVGKPAGPIQVGHGGRLVAPVLYPSMQEIWPALYSTTNIRVVEVDMVVEIRSEGGEYCMTPLLKVTYHRCPRDETERRVGDAGRRVPNLAVDEGPNVSYSCVDYSCGDWFAEMCQSVFRSGNSHQPLHDDPHDLMSVDP